MKPKRLKALKLLLSFFIVFHLCVIVVLANGGSFLGRHLGAYLAPYANFLGINTTWNFFSPDPAHTMYMKLIITDENDQGEEPVREEYIPAHQNQFEWNSNQRRFLYLVRYMMLDPSRIENYLLPWLCKNKIKGPIGDDDRVTIEFVWETIPTLDQALIEKSIRPVERTIFDGVDSPLRLSRDCAQDRTDS